MRIDQFVSRPPVTVEPHTTIEQAARRMADQGVGCVVVTEHDKIVGIVTDRDLVVRALARRLPIDGRIDAVMSSNVVAVDGDRDLRDVVRVFGLHAVRRLPVVHGTEVIGLVSLDDLLASYAGQLGDLTHGLTAQLLFPHAADPTPPPAVP